MITIKEKLNDLKKRYIWSGENLPSFDFEHFLLQEVCPVVFTSATLAPYVYSIICWDRDKFETSRFKAKFDVFFSSAMYLADCLRPYIPKNDIKLKKAFTDYEKKYPRIVLTHPFISTRSILFSPLQRRFSRKWTVNILNSIQDKEAYIKKRFQNYDTVSERLSWAEECLLTTACFLEALDTKTEYTENFETLFGLYREIKCSA